MPPWYLKDPETVTSWKFSLTPVSWRIQNAQDLRKKAAALAEGSESFVRDPSGEEGVAIMKAILGLGSFVSNCNLPNRGQIEGLPRDSVVETNAFFSRDSVRPLSAGRLPPAVEGMVARHSAAQETVLAAALSGDIRAALPAFITDPLVSIAPDEAERLFETMIDGTRISLEKYYKDV